MKNIKFLLGLLTVILIMTSCASMQGMTGEDYGNDPRTQQVGNRVYVQDPFYGTVVLERDPYTGRYYDVTYGSRYGTGYYGGSPYGGYRGGYNRGGGYYRGGRTYGGGTVQQKPAPTQGEIKQNRESTRKTILGN